MLSRVATVHFLYMQGLLDMLSVIEVFGFRFCIEVQKRSLLCGSLSNNEKIQSAG